MARSGDKPLTSLKPEAGSPPPLTPFSARTRSTRGPCRFWRLCMFDLVVGTLVLGLVVACASWSLTGDGQTGAKNGEWRAYRGDEASTAYSPLDLITRDNVKNLQVAWTWKFDNYGSAGRDGDDRDDAADGERRPLLHRRRAPHGRGRERRHRRDAVDVAAGRGRALRPGAAQGAPRRRLLDRRQGRAHRRRHAGFQLVALDAKTGCRSPASARAASSISSRSSTTTPSSIPSAGSATARRRSSRTT